MAELKVFSAGVAGKLARATADAFSAKNPNVQVNLQIGGSTAGVNRVLAGEVFDVLILADDSDISERLMPRYTDGYFIWGGNAMVVVGQDVTSENWAERLCNPASVITHRNPYDDPGGYRAVMALKLADRVEPGLAERIFANPGYAGLDRTQYAQPKDGSQPKFKGPQPPEPGHYDICYRSMPVALGFPFADFPAVMNLGDPAFEEVYRTASFAVDGPAGPCSQEVRGTTIFHAVCLPAASAQPALAQAFVREFLKTDFQACGFTSVQRAVGNWPLACEDSRDESSTAQSAEPDKRKDEPMPTYRDFLPQLATMPEFLGIEGEDIVALLEALKPEILCQKAGEERTPDNGPDVRRNLFCIRLSGDPIPAPDVRDDRYQNPDFTNCGMMMGEIPSFSCMFQNKSLPVKPGGPNGTFPQPPAPTEDVYVMRFSPEQFTTFVPEVAEAQGRMIRNFMGMLAQKVTDTRKMLFAANAELDALKGDAAE